VSKGKVPCKKPCIGILKCLDTRGQSRRHFKIILHFALAGQYEDSSDEWCSSEEELEKGAELALDGELEEEEDGAAELLDSLYCVACDKLFRTEGAKVMLSTCLLLYLGIPLETS
jgi:hypothetical protein